jgi:hypothetical protein
VELSLAAVDLPLRAGSRVPFVCEMYGVDGQWAVKGAYFDGSFTTPDDFSLVAELAGARLYNLLGLPGPQIALVRIP